MISRVKSVFMLFPLILSGIFSAAGQEYKQGDKAKPDEKKAVKQSKADATKNPTSEQVAESVIYIYGGTTGRAGLNQIRKTTVESGKLDVVHPDGTKEQVAYERRIVRGESLDKEKIRFDQEFPNAKYALIFSDNKIIGLFNETVFEPREDASKSFQNQIWHGLEALLRYKENGSTVTLAGREKVMGVDFYALEVTDKDNRKTKYYVSAKTFRVMWLEYAEGGVNYVRRFYDYRYAQGTLVPYRTVLLADNKQIEESYISTSTFGQKLEDNIFKP